MKVRVPLVSLAPWLVAALCLAEPTDSGWTVINRDRGITVSRKEQPGRGLPAFRGQGQLKGNVLQVLALMLDSDRVERWAHGINKSRRVKRIDAQEELLYLYSDVPWPVRDRDMVVRRRVEVVRPGQEFKIHLRCEPDAVPLVSGRVRVRECTSTFHLRKVTEGTTEVDYQMSLDPAGLLPKWAGNYVAKHVPFKTLVGLEERAAKTQGQYEAVVKAWSTAHF